MYYVKLLIGEKEGGNPCFRLLPEEVSDMDSGVHAEVIQCTCLAAGGGCAMIRMTDRDGVLSDKIREREHKSNENGECMIDRISNHQLIAMVMNNNCELSKIVSESGCFITSAVIEDEGHICWTLVGPNSSYVNNLISKLNQEGFPTERKLSSHADYVTTLTEKQEEAIRTAYENGFYEVPRKIKMEELCGILNCSKSTLDVALRTAERKIISHYMIENRDFILRKKK